MSHVILSLAEHDKNFSLYPMDFKLHRDGKGANPREHR